MKTIIKSGFLLMAVALIFSGCAASNSSTQTPAPGPVTYQEFYDNLSPYGTWIDYPTYGHVWNPRISGDFRPYATNGHWAYSDQGWAWASGYNWGWAPFHYGRWLYDDNYGWLWIPGYDWSPAWVTWGSVDNYYCWAPLMPGLDVNSQFGSWRPHSFYWNAVSRDHIYDRNLGSVIERPDRISPLAKRITIINNFNTDKHHLYYSKGPNVADVQKYVHNPIAPATIRDVSRINGVNHRGNVMNVYRPNIQDPRQVAPASQHMPQPRDFRHAEVAQSKPIRTEEQRPVMQRQQQMANIQHLPMQHANMGTPMNRGGVNPRGR
jgi:hypothetical protein